MIWDVLTKPDDYYNRVRRYSTGVILSIVYGRRGPTWEGPVADICAYRNKPLELWLILFPRFGHGSMERE